MSQCLRSKGKNTRTITQINDKEYLIEGETDWIRLGCQFDLSFITSANIDGGPFLLVGDSFLGKGRITRIQQINLESNQNNKSFMFKVSINPNE